MFFMVPPFFGKKWPFCPKIKNNFIVSYFSRNLNYIAPLFLDMCLDIFGAWINPKKSFDWYIILENIALFANTFFKYEIFVMDYACSVNECAVFCAHGWLKSTHGKY